MIYKNIKYGNVDNVVLVEFGHADILVSAATGENNSSLLLKTENTGKSIGEETSKYKGKTSDDYLPEVVFTFTKPESIDVVIEYLNECKKILTHPTTSEGKENN